MDIAAYWLKGIAKLKVDKASGDPAPHKPLLMLVILDLAGAGLLGQEIPWQRKNHRPRFEQSIHLNWTNL